MTRAPTRRPGRFTRIPTARPGAPPDQAELGDDAEVQPDQRGREGKRLTDAQSRTALTAALLRQLWAVFHHRRAWDSSSPAASPGGGGARGVEPSRWSGVAQPGTRLGRTRN